MKNTGALLKAKRESLNLALSEVALATKINPKVLNAIEMGDLANLPAKTILKGFVKSYALFLKMDVDAVLRSYQEEIAPPPSEVTEAKPAGGLTASVRRETPRPEGSGRRRVDEESSAGMRTAAVFVIVVLIGLIIGVRELIEKYQRERVVEQPVELQASPLAPAKPVETVKTEEAPKSEPAPAPATEEKVEPVAEAPKVEEKKAEAPPVQEEPKKEEVAVAPQPKPRPIDMTRNPMFNLVELRPGAAPVASKPPEPEVEKPGAMSANTTKPEPVAEAKTEEKPETKTEDKPANILKGAKREIILEALDKVDLEFKVKGETKRVSLAPTQVHTIRSDEPMAIDVSDGGAVNVILNGRERGPAGDLGKPKTIKIP